MSYLHACCLPCRSESRAKRGNVEQQRQRERQRQVAQFNKQQRLEDSCAYCFSSPSRPKELAIAVGQSTYLSLVQRGRLVEGHCVIAPAEHVASIRQVGQGLRPCMRHVAAAAPFMCLMRSCELLAAALAFCPHNHLLLSICVKPACHPATPCAIRVCTGLLNAAPLLVRQPTCAALLACCTRAIPCPFLCVCAG